jgi:hypothetical protein
MIGLNRNQIRVLAMTGLVTLVILTLLGMFVFPYIHFSNGSGSDVAATATRVVGQESGGLPDAGPLINTSLEVTPAYHINMGLACQTEFGSSYRAWLVPSHAEPSAYWIKCTSNGVDMLGLDLDEMCPSGHAINPRRYYPWNGYYYWQRWRCT